MNQFNESETRKNWIDEKLKKSGWDNIIPYHAGLDTSTLHKTAVEEFVTATGPVDYALFANGKLVAFVEAKKIGISPQNVLTQAQRYVKGAEQDGKTVPFIYSTNGESIWFQDLRITPSRSRTVQEF